jgi:hypothetical protein
MTTDLESRVRDLLHDAEVQPALLDPRAVVAKGRRVRAIRRARHGAIAVVSLGAAATLGVAALNVPATGHPLTPLVWAAGPTPSHAQFLSMTVYGHRFVGSVRESRIDHRATWVTSRLLDNGEVKDMAGVSPVQAGPEPDMGLQASTDPGVMFSLFPAGTTDVTAVFKGAVEYQLSTMRITSPFDGPDHVAVTVGTANPDDLSKLRGFTWIDASGRTRTSLPFDNAPLTGFESESSH